MIFDAYTARLRSLHQPDPAAMDELLLEHLETKSLVDAAIDQVDRLARVIDQDSRPLVRADREVAIRTRLHQLADVAQDAGVRIHIEHHPLESAPRG